jgi:acetyltransferase-like isoleucine patch superfamily enzyme
MKNFIKNFVLRLYFNLYNKRIKPWIITEKVRQLRCSFKAAGDGFHIMLPHRIYNPQFIIIGKNFSAAEGLKIEAIQYYQNQKFDPLVLIGDNVNIVSNCHIGCINKIQIGNNVLIASNVYISDHSHGEIVAESLKIPPMRRPLTSKGPVIIEDNVWIGENAAILPGVTVGKNAIIGANAVVTKNVRMNTVVAGNPAKEIKQLT